MAVLLGRYLTIRLNIARRKGCGKVEDCARSVRGAFLFMGGDVDSSPDSFGGSLDQGRATLDVGLDERVVGGVPNALFEVRLGFLKVARGIAGLGGGVGFQIGNGLGLESLTGFG